MAAKWRGHVFLPLLVQLLLCMVRPSGQEEEREWLGDPSCPYFVETLSYFSIYTLNSTPVDVGFRKARFFPLENVTECRADLESVLNSEHASLGEVYRAYLLKVENASFPNTRLSVSRGNATANRDVIEELAFVNCVPTVDTVQIFADVADLRSYATFSTVLPAGRSPEETAELCSVWQRIALFGIFDAKEVNLSSLAACGAPLMNMCRLIIDNTTLSEYPEGFLETFSGLMDLQLIKNKLREPPKFPWSRKGCKAVRNLKYSEKMHMDYTENGILSAEFGDVRLALNLDENNITYLEDFAFQGCLEMVSLKSNHIQRFSENTFANLSCLRLLELCGNNLTEIPLHAFDNMPEVRKLGLCDNELREILPVHLASMSHLQILNLANNRITTIEPEVFQQLHSLEEVDLHGNLLNTIPDGLLDQENLTTLNLDFNKVNRFSAKIFTLERITMVSIKNSSIAMLNFTDVCAKYLSGELTLSASLLSMGKGLRQVDLTQSAPLQVFLRVENSACRAALQVILCSHKFLIDSLHCGCEVLEVAQFLKNMIVNSSCGNVQQNVWSCASPEELRGRSILSLQPEETYCPVVLEACLRSCRCFQRAGGARRVIADCRGVGLTSLPERMPGNVEVELWLEDNAVSSLAWRPYLPRLHTLRLSRNALTELEEDLLKKLDGLRELSVEGNLLASLPPQLAHFSEQLSILRLSTNPFRCDCHARWLQTWVASSPPALQDGSAITCNLEGKGGSGVLLQRVPAEELVCVADAVRARVVMQAGVSSVVVVLLAVGVGAALLFRRQLKLWLYVHTSWHPFDRDPPRRLDQQQEEQDDYDVAVVCGCEQDAWVWSHVSERLEKDQRLRVLHCWRDFRLGLTHGQNLARAAARCRHLLLVLTPESLGDSLVGAAVRVGVEAAHHRRANFLVLLLHDCRTLQTTDEGLKDLLKGRRFISTKDRHFLKKIMYFMPQDIHRRKTQDRARPNEDNKRTHAINGPRREMEQAQGKDGVINPGLDIHIEMNEDNQIPNPDNNGELNPQRGLDIAMEPLTPAAEDADPETLPIFVWYHGQDLTFVLQQLVEPLRALGARWILEDKDFVPGVSKEENLVQAVEASRATLVVLSACSLEDEWGLHAFQVALSRQMAGRHHVVAMCRRRDCPDELLDKEMQQFLQSSMSLHEGGPWFRERLLQFVSPEKVAVSQNPVMA